jgi:hypothetical protein
MEKMGFGILRLLEKPDLPLFDPVLGSLQEMFLFPPEKGCSTI